MTSDRLTIPNLRSASRGRPGLFVVLLVAMMLAVACMNLEEQTAFDLVNAERRHAGLGELEPNAELALAAREFAQVLASEGRLRHSDTRRFLRDGRWARVGENVGVANGGPGSEQVLQQTYLNSPAHRATQRGPFSHGGVGVAISPDGRVFQVQLFAGLRR